MKKSILCLVVMMFCVLSGFAQAETMSDLRATVTGSFVSGCASISPIETFGNATSVPVSFDLDRTDFALNMPGMRSLMVIGSFKCQRNSDKGYVEVHVATRDSGPYITGNEEILHQRRITSNGPSGQRGEFHSMSKAIEYACGCF